MLFAAAPAFAQVPAALRWTIRIEVAQRSPSCLREQLRGQPLDATSHLFSLGLVVYEMVTGRPAFAGETSAVIAAAILSEAPVRPRDLREPTTRIVRRGVEDRGKKMLCPSEAEPTVFFWAV